MVTALRTTAHLESALEHLPDPSSGPSLLCLNLSPGTHVVLYPYFKAGYSNHFVTNRYTVRLFK